MFYNVYHVKGNEYIHNAKVYGLADSIRGAKYPMSTDLGKVNNELTKGIISLALSEPGSGHDQWLTGVVCQFDLTFTTKAWIEAERYHFFDFISSQSTMHRIARFDLDNSYNEYVDKRTIEIVKEKVQEYNDLIAHNAIPGELNEKYLEILYNNPSGFYLTARMTTNYRELKTMYRQRKTHRLPDWYWFCEWVEQLPASFLITGNDHITVVADSPKVIAISGKAGSGKDTAAKTLCNKLKEHGYRVLVTHYADLLKYICKTFFGWNGAKDERGRQMLQYVGTNMVRTQYPDFWVEFISKIVRIFGDKWDFVLIPDARFPNEISRLQEDGINTVHIRVERPNTYGNLTEEQKKHPSETALDDIKPDFYIQNDGGIDDLDDKIDEWIKENVKL